MRLVKLDSRPLKCVWVAEGRPVPREENEPVHAVVT